MCTTKEKTYLGPTAMTSAKVMDFQSDQSAVHPLRPPEANRAISKQVGHVLLGWPLDLLVACPSQFWRGGQFREPPFGAQQSSSFLVRDPPPHSTAKFLESQFYDPPLGLR